MPHLSSKKYRGRKAVLPRKERPVVLQEERFDLNSINLALLIESPTAIMEAVDQLPTRWRALVYDYGFQMVAQAVLENISYEEALGWFRAVAKAKQSRREATNYK